MKKWLLGALAACLLIVCIGCDSADAPTTDTNGVSDTVATTDTDTTPADSSASTEPEATTEAETQSSVHAQPSQASEADTESASEAETVLLPDESAVSLWESILPMPEKNASAPIQVTVTGGLDVAASWHGFPFHTTLPLSGYYAADTASNLTMSYAIPLVGEGVCTLADGTLYMNTATATTGETAVRYELFSPEETPAPSVLWTALTEAWQNARADLSVPARLDGVLPGDSFDGYASLFGASEQELSDAIASLREAVAESVAPTHMFRSITASENTETGEITLVLAGLSDEVLHAMETVLAGVPVCPDLHEETPDYAALVTLYRLLSEQAEDIFTLTFTVDANGVLTDVGIVVSVDVSELSIEWPEQLASLNGSKPETVTLSLSYAISHDEVAIEAPANADAYTAMEWTDLLPTKPAA